MLVNKLAPEEKQKMFFLNEILVYRQNAVGYSNFQNNRAFSCWKKNQHPKVFQDFWAKRK